MDPRKLREALRRQGIYVHENDPVLDMAVICETVLTDTLKAVETAVNAAADRTSAAAAQTADASRKAAEAIVNEAAEFFVSQFREAAEEARRSVLANLHQEAERTERASRIAVTSAWIVGGVGTLLLASIIGILAAGVPIRL